MILREKPVYIITAITAILWCCGITFQPVLLTDGLFCRFMSHMIRLGCAPLCHQNPERSLYIAGHPMAVCSRCTGVYYGALLGILIFPWFRPTIQRMQSSVRWLFLAAVPVCIDIGLARTGFITSGHIIRLGTGAVLGMVAMCYILPGIMEWMTSEQTITRNAYGTHAQ